MDKTASAPKVLICDIETAPLVVYTFGIRDQYINHEQILEDWCLLSYSAKWYGKKKIYYRCTGGRGSKKTRDDKELLTELAALLDEADFLVGHNVAAFDLKRIAARMMHHGLNPFSPVKCIDTYQAAKRAGAFSSHKLGFLAEALTDERKDSHSDYPGMSLHKACLADEPKAWKAMRSYNQKDVLATEALYTALRPWIKSHPALTLFADNGEQVKCPKCLSTAVESRGIITTTSGKYQRVHCIGCGSWSRAKQNLISVDDRKKALTSV